MCNAQIWNPSFDVTPAKLIEGIITEKGLIHKAGDAIAVAAFVASQARNRHLLSETLQYVYLFGY